MIFVYWSNHAITPGVIGLRVCKLDDKDVFHWGSVGDISELKP